MAKSGGGDEFEILGYFVGFWLFVFNESFRNAWVQEFRQESFLSKIFSVFEAMCSILFGVIGPAYLFYYLLVG